MRTIEEHQRAISELVEAALASRGTEFLPVTAAASGSLSLGPASLGRELAHDVIAPLDLPPFDNSQMDGYAVRSSDLAAGPRALTVGRRIPAGVAPPPLLAGTAAPIMTGAAIPDGADAVVQIELADPPRFLDEAAGPFSVTLPGPVPAGQFVRSRGSDLPGGSVLQERGTVLRPAHWGVLASSGVETVEVIAPLRVMLVSTGAELATGPGNLGAAKIHDANTAALGSAIASLGVHVSTYQATDDVDDFLAFIQGLDGADPTTADGAAIDLVVTTGGVSAGAYEVVREALHDRGVEFASVAMQPGGPQGWGAVETGHGSIPIVCFPGNPVSALVSFEAFLHVPLARGAHSIVADRDRRAPLAEAADSPPGKHQIRRARLDADGRVHFVGGPSSHLLHHYAQATVLAHIPVGVSRVEPGDEVVVWALDE